ncbi:hypothetical protein ZHAS_00012001 [Anopheles sinensis]|uniref:Uncharacterized protein n=1 Tax=Anopheles sinensis TaxID=74873 RepID=A0A084W1R8_ANOSI|nr:hypothetical protein ZHAS_00012001 [Anopheles sinensis]
MMAGASSFGNVLKLGVNVRDGNHFEGWWFCASSKLRHTFRAAFRTHSEISQSVSISSDITTKNDNPAVDLERGDIKQSQTTTDNHTKVDFLFRMTEPLCSKPRTRAASHPMTVEGKADTRAESYPPPDGLRRVHRRNRSGVIIIEF